MAIGLDLGTNSIKTVNISLKKKSLDNYKIIDLDLNEDSKTRTKTALKKMLSNRQWASNRLVNIGVQGSTVVTRYPSLPKMSEDELTGAMKFELEQHIPFKKDEVEYDFRILKEFSPSPKNMKIILAAGRKESIAEQIKIITEAGLKLSKIDTNSAALINAFTNGNHSAKEEFAALSNIGFETTNIDIIKGDEPFLSRDIPFGGASMAKLIAKDKNISFVEAEQLLKTKEGKEEILELNGENLRTLIDEVRSSFSYCETQFGKGVSKVYLSGGMANLLQSFIQKHLSVSVSSWDATLNLKVDAKLKDIETDKSQLAIAIGLALRS